MGARATGVVALAWAVTAGVAAPEPPLWPDRFHVMSAQTTPGGKDVVHLFYDWPGGRNLNVITGQALERAGKGTLWDFERQDGLTFYYTPRTRECRTIDMKYGLLPPTWLRDKPAAELVGQGVTVGPFRCNVWTKGESDTPGVPFITYYAEEQTDRPVRWAFYTGQELDIIMYAAGETLPEVEWQLPPYCQGGMGAAPATPAGSSAGQALLDAWHARIAATLDQAAGAR